MKKTAQNRALENYRRRLNERGLARFEVLGLDTDRVLIRSLARALSEGGPEAVLIRARVRQTIEGEAPVRGGILRALRRSPLVGEELQIVRDVVPGRRVDL